MAALKSLRVEARGLPIGFAVCNCNLCQLDRVMCAPAPGQVVIDVPRFISRRMPADRQEAADPERVAKQIAAFYVGLNARRILIVRELVVPPSGGDASAASRPPEGGTTNRPPEGGTPAAAHAACAECGPGQHKWRQVCPLLDDPAYETHPAVEAGCAVWWECRECGAWRPHHPSVI